MIRRVAKSVNGWRASCPRRPKTARQFQLELNRGLVDGRDPVAIESAQFGLLLSNRDISEVTFTYAVQTGFDANGNIQLAASPRGQISVMRGADDRGQERWWSRHVRQEGERFVAESRELESSARFSALPLRREGTTDIPDPTLHPTFMTPASQNFFGQLLWSDLHWSQLDAQLPATQRRAEVSVQQAITDAEGNFAGVLRVGLLTQQLDRAVQLRLAPPGRTDPHRIFICDAEGRLITPLSASDRLQEFGDDLRIASKNLPPEVSAALANPKLRAVGENATSMSGHFRLNGEEFLTTFRALPETQGWIVGIVVPRSYYLGRLALIRNRLLVISLGLMSALIAGGALILRRVKAIARPDCEREPQDERI